VGTVPRVDCSANGGEGDICPCTGVGSTDCRAEGSAKSRSCLTISNKVQLAVKATATGQAFLYATWHSVDTNVQPLRNHVNLERIDITNVDFPISGSLHRTAAVGGAQDWEPSISVSGFTSNVGWFFYTDFGGTSCSTVYNGYVATDLALATLTQVAAFSSPFPNVITQHGGMGDYTSSIRRGLGDGAGSLFPTWAESTVAYLNPSCLICQTQSYNVRVRGEKVTP
jgi:hypothetical protein